MLRLPPNVTCRSIRDLKIPGSHDSAAFELFIDMKCATDNSSAVQFIGNHIPPSRHIIRRWAITQHHTIKEQLNLGIRYLDLRVSRSVYDNQVPYRMVHTLFGRPLEQIFESVRDFLDENLNEFVILDINHVYSMRGDLDIDSIIALVHDVFGKWRLCPPQDLSAVSLDYLRENKYQLIVLMSECDWKEEDTRIWCQDWIRSPYANTNKLRRLFPYIETHLRHACHTRLHVTQGILTPRLWDIVKGVFARGSTLESRLADQCTKATVDWIQRKQEELEYNIVICDFVEKYNYCDTVVALNYK
uniref:PLCXc domain-containing protein n=1 Tax=Steinernema glaseri TaxID=37863 RepID=A0A1I7YS93_9BILA